MLLLLLALQVDEVVLRPPGLDHNVVNAADVVIDQTNHLAYLLGRETAVMGVLDIKAQTLMSAPLPSLSRSVWLHPKSGTLYVLHAGSISIAPRKSVSFKTAAVPDAYIGLPDPEADGLYLACGQELVRVAPDGTTRTVLKAAAAFRQFAIDAKRGLVHLHEPPARLHTHKLADGSAVAARDIPIPAEGLVVTRVHVHAPTGRVIVHECDGFKDNENVLAIAGAEAGDFKTHKTAGAKDGQHSILHPNGDVLIVANDNSGNVSFVDVSKDTPSCTNVATGGKANGLAYDRKRDRLWVQTWSTRVACVDVGKKAPAGGFDAFTTGHIYRGIAVDEDLGRVVAVCGYQGGCMVAVHDAKEGKTKLLRTGCGPMDAVFAGGRLLVATNDDRVLFLDGKAVSEAPTPIMMARALAVEPKSGQVLAGIGEWVFPNTLYWLDAAARKFTAGPQLPRGPFAIAAPGGPSAWVLGWADEQLAEVDLDKRTLRRVALPGTLAWTPRHLAATPECAVVLRSRKPMIIVVRRGEEPRGVDLPAEPAALALSDGRAWIAAEGCVLTVGLEKFDVARVDIGKSPVDVAMDGATAVVADIADRALWRMAEKPERIALDAPPDAVASHGGVVYVAARTPERLWLLRVKGGAVEKLFEGAHPYGSEAGVKTFTRCTNTWVPFSRFAFDVKAGRGALVDYLGGRVLLFPLK